MPPRPKSRKDRHPDAVLLAKGITPEDSFYTATHGVLLQKILAPSTEAGHSTELAYLRRYFDGMEEVATKKGQSYYRTLPGSPASFDDVIKDSE